MLPMIGLMVGFYILFRMVDAIASAERNAFVKACAVGVILTTVFFMFSLADSSMRAQTSVPGMLR